jgi:hypothetical protein
MTAALQAGDKVSPAPGGLELTSKIIACFFKKFVIKSYPYKNQITHATNMSYLWFGPPLKNTTSKRLFL